MEEWREVFDGYYVSNKNGWKNLKNLKKKKPVGFITHGYRVVSVKGRHYRYHILVAKAFPEICGKWFDGAQVHHINFNSLDNRPENLIVLSPSEHSKLHYTWQSDEFKHGSKKRGEIISKSLKGRTAKEKWVPVVQKTKSGDIIREYESITKAASINNWSQGNICMACKGQLKTAYGYIWEYKKETA